MRWIYSSKLYKNSPIIVQNLIVTAKGLMYRTLKTGRSFKTTSNYLLYNETLSSDQIESYQNTKLRNLILLAYSHVPYYRKLFDKSGLSPEDIKTKNDLIKIPYLSKQSIRQYFDEFVSRQLVFLHPVAFAS